MAHALLASEKKGAHLLIEALQAHRVRYIFSLPGASIDPILNVLADEERPELITCRHEQSAAFMAQAWGRITGTPGVCIATAGPGVTNLVTGIATADAERCPLIAITGQVSPELRFKRSHQHMDSVNLFRPITKWSTEISYLPTLPDILANAFRIASTPRQGAVHLSVPVNILNEEVTGREVTFQPTPASKMVDHPSLYKAAALLAEARNPILLLGMAASQPEAAPAVRAFLDSFPYPICATFEAAGVVPRKHVGRFMGRLGIFPNQPGDLVLRDADVILSIGFDLIEYDPSIWNRESKSKIIHLDYLPATVDQSYQPDCEVIGDIGSNLMELEKRLSPPSSFSLSKAAQQARHALREQEERAASLHTTPVHPLRLIHEIRSLIDDETTLISDVGSHQYWLARNFFCYEPQHFLTSMGFQSMGISLPWAIAASLARPGKKVLSISGDGSFLMCSMELETAVRLSLPIVHMVWEDEGYNLVKIQEVKKYGRDSGASFGPIDTVEYSEAMGALALRINHTDEIRPILKAALDASRPVVISVPINYADNMEICQT